MNLNSTGYADFVGANQIRLTLGDAGTAGTNTANWIRGTANQVGFNTAGDIFHWEVLGNEKMRLTPSAELGLGTNNPQNVLHIKTTAAGGPQIELEAASGTANSAFINFDGTSLQLSTQRDMVNGSKRDTGKSWGGINIIGQATGSSINFATSEGNNNAATNRMIISKEGYVTKPFQPHFRVSQSATSGGVVTFNNVHTNIGGHWSSSNNAFTAPIAGVYQFNFGMLHENSASYYARVNYIINGVISGKEKYGDTLEDWTGSFTSSTLGLAIYLNANDYVQLYLEGTPLYQTGNYAAFSGFLAG
jgi:hypothetical protein